MSPSTRAALCAFMMLLAPLTGRAEGILYANPLGVAWKFYSAGFDIIFKHTGHFTFGPVAGYHYSSSSDGVEKGVVYGGRLSYFQNEVLKSGPRYSLALEYGSATYTSSQSTTHTDPLFSELMAGYQWFSNSFTFGLGAGLQKILGGDLKIYSSSTTYKATTESYMGAIFLNDNYGLKIEATIGIVL